MRRTYLGQEYDEQGILELARQVGEMHKSQAWQLVKGLVKEGIVTNLFDRNLTNDELLEVKRRADFFDLFFKEIPAQIYKDGRDAVTEMKKARGEYDKPVV